MMCESGHWIQQCALASHRIGQRNQLPSVDRSVAHQNAAAAALGSFCLFLFAALLSSVWLIDRSGSISWRSLVHCVPLRVYSLSSLFHLASCYSCCLIVILVMLFSLVCVFAISPSASKLQLSECWFCLAAPQCETHLVCFLSFLSQGNEDKSEIRHSQTT